MYMNSLIIERMQIVVGLIPKDLGAGANASDVVSMKNYQRCGILFIKDVGKSGDDATLTVLQCTSVAPSNAKALNFTKVFIKQGLALTAIGQWTRVDQAAANTYVNTLGGEAENMYYIEVLGEDLDVDNGYDCIQVTIGDVGTAGAIGTLLFLLADPRFGGSPSQMPSAIVD